jgi:ankyrin repeat protein
VVEKALAAYPDLMLEASETGRWHALALIAEAGFPVDGTKSRTALHHAAGAGSLEAVRTLLDLGADANKKDDTYNATPLGWAEYMRRTEVAEYLRSLQGVSAS